MKKVIFLYVISGFIFCVSAQNNFDFESWTNGTPTGWYANNIPGIFVPIEQTTDAHSGSFAVKGSVIPAAPNGYAPGISAGADLKGFPINTRISALKGWYKFNSDSGDAFVVVVGLNKEGRLIGSGGFYTTDNAAGYQQFTARMTNNSVEVPDTIQITIIISNAAVHSQSVFYLDDLSYDVLTDVEDIVPVHAYKLEQNYPNPFNPSTVIAFTLPKRGVTKLTLYDILGTEIKTLLNSELDEGSHSITFDASGLSSGVYLYKLQVNDFVSSRKMIVTK